MKWKNKAKSMGDRVVSISSSLNKSKQANSSMAP